MGTYYPNLLATRILYDSDRSSASASDDGDVANWIKTNKFILATLIGYDGKDTAASAYKLRWRNETDNPGGSFTDLGATGEMKYAASSSVLSDGTALTEANHRCTGPGGMTWQNGLESVNDNLVPDAGTFDLGSDCYTEFQWAIDPADAHDGDQYTFQLYNNTEGAGDECLAQLTIVMPVKLAHADIVGSGTLSAAAKVTKKVHADLVGGGTLAAAAQCLVLVAADLVGSGTLTATATKITPPPATQQVISGGYYDNLNSSTTEYQMIQGGTTWGSTEGNYAVPWPCAGKIVEFGFAVQTGQITAGSYTATLRKNSAATELAVTVNSGTSEGVDTGEVTVAAGDLICIQSTPSAVTGTPYACWYIVFEPTTPGDTVILGLAQRSTASLYYSSFFVNAPYGLPTADGFNLHSLIPTPGTLSKFYAKTPASTDGSNYLTFTVYKNGTVTDLAAVQSDAQYPDLTDSVSLADQDRIQVRIAQTGSVAGAVLLWSAVFHPDTHGEFIFACSTSDEPASAGTEYHGFNSQYYTSVWDADETRYWHLLGACTLKKIRVQLAVAPGSSKSRAFTVRRVATGDTSLAVTLSESETDDTYSTDVAVSQLWKMNLKHVPSGTPTASTGQRWAILGYIAPTGAILEAEAAMSGSGSLSASAKVTRKVAAKAPYDNFEWGSDGDPITDSEGRITWLSNAPVGSSLVEIDEGVYYDGSRSILMYRGDTNWPYARVVIDPTSDKYKYRLWVRRNSAAGIHIRIGGSTYRIDVGVANTSGNYFYYNHSDSYVEPGGSLAADTWQLWEIRDIDYTNGYFSFYVNKDLKGRWEMNTYGDYDGVFHIGPTGTTASAWMDQFSGNTANSKLVAAAKKTITAAAALGGSGTLAAAAKVTRAVAADMVGSGTLAAAAKATKKFAADLAGSGSLTAAAKCTYKADASDAIDDFEWGNDGDPVDDADKYGGWFNDWVSSGAGAGFIGIDDAQAYSGTQSLGFYRADGNWPAAESYRLQAASYKYTITSRVRRDTDGGWWLEHGDGTRAIALFGNSGGWLGYYDYYDQWTALAQIINADTWYEVRLENIDWTACEFDLWFGGVFRGRLTMRPRSTAGSFIRLGAVGETSGSWCWFDRFGWLPSHCHVSAAAKVTREVAADLVGSGTLAASAQLFKAVHAECVGSGSLSASAKVTRAVAADLAGSGTLDASIKLTLKVAADLVGEGFLAADATIAGKVEAAAELTGSGTLSASAKVTKKVAADLVGSGTVDATVHRTTKAAADLVGSGTLAAEGVVGLLAAASLSGTGSLAAAAKRTRGVAAVLVGAGTVDATVHRTTQAAAALAGAGTLAAAAKRTMELAAVLTGAGFLAAAAELIAAAIAMYGDMVIRPDLYGDISVRPDLTGNLSMRPDLTGVFSYKGEDQE